MEQLTPTQEALASLLLSCKLAMQESMRYYGMSSTNWSSMIASIDAAFSQPAVGAQPLPAATDAEIEAEARGYVSQGYSEAFALAFKVGATWVRDTTPPAPSEPAQPAQPAPESGIVHGGSLFPIEPKPAWPSQAGEPAGAQAARDAWKPVCRYLSDMLESGSETGRTVARTVMHLLPIDNLTTLAAIPAKEPK
jgi:hypothetical protein